ncbi:MAG TPA: DUF3352 domain-containing protein [Thermoflexus sp.]|nr:DUF3352 domain-containing protein [Thermoflexus sp.]
MLLVASRDLNASNRFLERLREQAGEEGPPFEERTYGQTRYWFRPPKPGTQEPPVVLTTVRDFVVIATQEKAFQAVVDRADGKGEPLSRSPRFQRVMGELPKQAVLLGYMDYPSILAYRRTLAQTSGVPPFEELLEAWPSGQIAQATEGGGFSGELLPEGIRVQYVTIIQREKLSPEVREMLDAPAISERMLARVPEDVLFVLQTPQIGKAIRQTLNAMRANPDVERQLEDMQSALGIDLEEDFLSWMTGDLALMLHRVSTPVIPELPVGFSTLIETDRPEEARAGLERLERFLQISGVTVEEMEISGRPVRVLIDPSGTQVAAYAVGPEAVGIGFPPEALAKAHPERSPERAIQRNPRFQQVLRHLPGRSNGLVFVDTQRFWDLIEDLIPPSQREGFEQDVRPFLEPIKGIGSASEASPGSTVQRGVFFIYIVPESQ